MTLKEYLLHLQTLIKDNPEAMDLEVVSSIDQEGNAFFKVFETPAIGVFENGQFYPDDSLEEDGYDKNDINAISLN